MLSEKEYRAYREKYGNKFQAAMGAEAIKRLLQEIDLEKETEHLKEELKTAQGQRRTRAIKRLEVVESFRNSGNKPDWMILRCSSCNSTRITSNGSIRWWTFCYF